MKRLAEQFVELMRDFEWELDYSEASVETLEELIDGQFADWRPGGAARRRRRTSPSPRSWAPISGR